MTDVQTPGPTPQVPLTCRLLEGSGICADYRKKIDELFLKEREAAAKSDLVSKASSVAVKAALAVALTAIGGLGSLSGYLWYRFVTLDAAMTGAAKYSLVPVGTVFAWTGLVPSWPKDPDGKDREPAVGDWHYYWRECKGEEIPLEHHEDLNAVIGAIYGKADPGKVRLPDFRGYFLRGLGNGSADLGAAQLDAAAVDLPAGVAGKGYLIGVGLSKPWDDRTSYERSAVVRNQNKSDDGAENRPKNYAVHWIIRVR